MCIAKSELNKGNAYAKNRRERLDNGEGWRERDEDGRRASRKAGWNSREM